MSTPFINAGGSGGGIPEAPEDGTPYARQDAGWVQAANPADVAEALDIMSEELQDAYNEIEALNYRMAAFSGNLVQGAADTPPSTVLDDVGKMWIVDSGATDAWAGHDSDLAICTAPSSWKFVTPQRGTSYRSAVTLLWEVFDGTSWVTES
ncbi:MAG: DUF2793 domain-containing protein [Xanthomonadaceae bacterium]|nr:DUF2793 domain-containing protein [Xanthomonadaceae bacterium]